MYDSDYVDHLWNTIWQHPTMTLVVLAALVGYAIYHMMTR